ncbi:hypothetical protein MKX01_006623 [Papaver californicum]|nr:hypothetical protein MKX01_006623 [Papaver californicum]
MRDLLKDWGEFPYQRKASIFIHYLQLLYLNHRDIHSDKRDVITDLEILKELQTTLEDNIVQGKKCYLEFRIVGLCAYTKIGMMLQEIDRILKKKDISIPDNDSWEWIKKKLHKVDWEGYLRYAPSNIPDVVKEALAKGGQYADKVKYLENFIVGEINVEDPAAIKKRLKVYLKEAKDNHKMLAHKMDCIGPGPSMCEFIEEARSKLSDRCSEMPDDDSKERPDGVQTTIQAVDSAFLSNPNTCGIYFIIFSDRCSL